MTQEMSDWILKRANEEMKAIEELQKESSTLNSIFQTKRLKEITFDITRRLGRMEALNEVMKFHHDSLEDEPVVLRVV